MPMTLYCMDGSPPNRAVYLCLEALGLKPERQGINPVKGEQWNPFFTQINPQHTVPTLKDGDFVVWDSHAICAYLVSKYGKDDSLYPKDLQKRAVVDQRLHFDSGVLFPRLRDITDQMLFMRCKDVPKAKIKSVLEAYDLMEKFLEGHDYIAGDNFTIADFCCVSTVSSLAEPMRISASGHPRMSAWLQRCKDTLPGYQQAQERGLAMLKAAVDNVLG